MRFVWPKLPVVIATIVGLMGTGKTTLAAKLAHEWKNFRRSKNPLIVYAQVDSPSVIEETVVKAAAFAEQHNRRAVAIVFDDVSFVLESREKSSRQAMNVLARLRHYAPSIRYWLVIIVIHYLRGVPPFLRAAHYRFITSITPAEIQQLREVIPEPVLWDFYEVWRANPGPGLALVDAMGNYTILKWRKPKIPKSSFWDIVVSQDSSHDLDQKPIRKYRAQTHGVTQ